ncbi:MAG: transcription antitermination factor NusB [Aquificae bacterium]|nr:transcription antitermination factor NusB [Aquificota bacterium]
MKVGKYRKKAREILFKTLYSYDLKGENLSDILKYYIEEFKRDNKGKINTKTVEYANSIAKGIEKHLKEIDKIIERHLKGWRLERLGYLERALLRLGTYELVFSDIQDKGRVFIDILDLAKCYLPEEDSIKFINGVLSGIFKKITKKYQSDKRKTIS